MTTWYHLSLRLLTPSWLSIARSCSRLMACLVLISINSASSYSAIDWPSCQLMALYSSMSDLLPTNTAEEGPVSLFSLMVLTQYITPSKDSLLVMSYITTNTLHPLKYTFDKERYRLLPEMSHSCSFALTLPTCVVCVKNSTPIVVFHLL